MQNISKKAQAQNLETIIVILIVTIIIAIGTAIFYNLQSSSLDNLKQLYRQNQAINLLSTLPLAPELQYTELGYDKSSIDAVKLLTPLKLKGNLKIEVQQLYPEKPKATCSKSNYSECSTYIIYESHPNSLKNQEIISSPVLLYHPIEKQYSFAILTITTYY